jgi:hypothetical protein
LSISISLKRPPKFGLFFGCWRIIKPHSRRSIVGDLVEILPVFQPSASKPRRSSTKAQVEGGSVRPAFFDGGFSIPRLPHGAWSEVWEFRDEQQLA